MGRGYVVGALSRGWKLPVFHVIISSPLVCGFLGCCRWVNFGVGGMEGRVVVVVSGET